MYSANGAQRNNSNASKMHHIRNSTGDDHMAALCHQVGQTALPAGALQLQDLHSFQEENIAFELASALHVEDEVIPNAAKLDLALEFLVAQALSADGVVESVPYDSL
jgi:hypothetical protein